METIDRNRSITEKIKKLIKERGFKSLNELREAAKIDNGNWSRMVNGKRNWTLKHLITIAPLLKTSLDFLVGLSEHEINSSKNSTFEAHLKG